MVKTKDSPLDLVIITLAPALGYMALGAVLPGAVFISQIIFFLGPGLIWAYQNKSLFLHHPHALHISFVSMIFMLGLSLGIQQILPMWNEWIPMSEYFQKSMEQMSNSILKQGYIIGLIKLAVIPAICEEYFFRGLLLSEYMKHMRVEFAVILNAAIFALFHLNVSYAPFFFLIGLALATMRIASSSLLPGMVGHFINNALSITLVLWTK